MEGVYNSEVLCVPIRKKTLPANRHSSIYSRGQRVNITWPFLREIVMQSLRHTTVEGGANDFPGSVCQASVLRLPHCYILRRKKKSYRNLPNNSLRDFLQRYRVPFRLHCYVWHLGVGGIAACTWVKRALPTHLVICSVRLRLAVTHLFSRHCVHMHSKVSAAHMCSHFYFTV